MFSLWEGLRVCTKEIVVAQWFLCPVWETFTSDHVYRSVFNLIVRARNVPVALSRFTSLFVHIMAGLWSHPDNFPLMPEEVTQTCICLALEGPPGIGYVDGDMNIV